MHEYDIALKSFLRNGRESLRAIASMAVERWHNVELPEVRNLRVDLLGEATDGRLLHIELQSTHDANMALRMMEYCPAVWRQFGRFPEQVVLYVGEAPLRMKGSLRGPGFSFGCRIVDIRELDGESLLTSERIEDNIIAVLARVSDQRATVNRVLGRIAECAPAERARALTGFMILAGLRRPAADVIEQEASKMPILDDIMDHPVLGPRIRRAEEKAEERGLERGLEKGLKEGLKEGLKKGQHEGELAVLMPLVEKRFGTVPSWLRDRLEKMSVSEIQAVALRLLDARSAEDLLP